MNSVLLSNIHNESSCVHIHHKNHYLLVGIWEKYFIKQSGWKKKSVNYEATFFKIYATVVCNRQDTEQANILFFKLI